MAWTARWPLVLLAATALVASCAEGTDTGREDDDDDGGETIPTGSDGGSGGTTTTSDPATGGSGGEEIGPCDEDPCRLVSPQCGCPSSEQCSLVGVDRECIEAGDVPLGQVCNGPDQEAEVCQPGSLCTSFATKPNPTSICKRFCTSDDQCPGPGGVCELVLRDNADNALATLCSESCNPINNTGCPAGAMCLLQLEINEDETAVERAFTVCANAGSRFQGGSCEDFDDCAPGFTCIRPEMAAPLQCARYVAVTGANPCPPGTSLGTFLPGAVVDGVEYGVCLTPPPM
ncbi:MAG: hypothetical protein AAGA56_09725 [Myxococcota bacterium]